MARGRRHADRDPADRLVRRPVRGVVSEPRVDDAVFTTVYATHFLAGLTLAAVLWVREPRGVGEVDAALPRHLLRRPGRLHPLPDGATVDGLRPGPDGSVSRITNRGWADVGLDRVDLILHGVGNPVAAMPSLHAGISFLIALYAIQRLRSRWRWAARCYPLAMSTALVYFAEHYVIDIVAGGLLAVLVLVGSSTYERRRPVSVQARTRQGVLDQDRVGREARPRLTPGGEPAQLLVEPPGTPVLGEDPQSQRPGH